MLCPNDKYNKYIIGIIPVVSFLFFIIFYYYDVFFQSFVPTAIHIIWKTLSAALIIASLCGTGLAVLYTPLKKRQLPFPALAAFLCGSVVVSQALFLLGQIKITALPYLLFGLGTVSFLAFACTYRKQAALWISGRFETIRSLDAASKLLLVLIIASLLLPFLAAFYPPYFSDETEYHLLNPRNFLQQDIIRGDPENPYTFFPCSFEMLYTYGMSVFDDRVPKLLHWFFHVLSLLLLYRIGRKQFSRKAGLLASSLFAVTPITAFYSSTAFITSGIIAFFLASLFFLLEFLESRARIDLYLSMAFGFFLLTMHHSSALLAAFLLVFFFWEARRKKAEGMISATVLIAAAALFLVIVIPFLARNLVHTGDPFYPVFSSVLKNRNWNSFVDYCITQQFYFSKGTGRSLLSFVTLPFSLTFSYIKFSTFDHPLGIGPLYLMLTPFIFSPSFKKQGVFLSALLSSLAALLIWFVFMPHFARFIFPLLPVSCLFLAEAFTGFRNSSGHKHYGKAIVFSVLIAALINIVSLSHSLNIEYLARMVTGQFQEDAFLRDVKEAAYESTAFFNEKVRDTSKGVAFFKNFSPYYCKLPCYSFYTSPTLSRIFMTRERIQHISKKGFYGKALYNCPILSKEELLRGVRAIPVGFMAFTEKEYNEMKNPNLDFIIQNSRLVFKYGDYFVYEIK